MKRVTGIGGIFFNARDPVALRAWYKSHLAVDVQDWGGAAFRWTDEAGQARGGHDHLVHRRRCRRCLRPEQVVLHDQLPRRRPARFAAGVAQRGMQRFDKTDDSEYGKFGWVIDPEGNKIELWQPPEGQ